MTIKDELLQRLKYEQQMEEYNNKKQALQNQTNNASQSSLDNSGAYIEGATGNQWADKGLDTASMAMASTGNPLGLAAAAGIQLFKGISNYANQDKNANTERSIQAANQSMTNNLNDLNERKANMRNTSLQNMNRLASMQNTGNTQQSLSDMIDNALRTRQNYSIGNSYEDKAQRGIDTAQAYNQIAQQEQANKNAAIVDTAKNMASTVAGGMAGAASGAGEGLSSAAGDTALNEAGSALGSAASTAGENAAKDVSGEILNYNYDIPENVSNLSDYRSGGINTPVDTQTLQNEPSPFVQNANYEGVTGGAAPVIDNVQIPNPEESAGDLSTPQGDVSAEEKASIINSIKNNLKGLGLKGKDFVENAVNKGSDIVDSVKDRGGDVVNNVKDRLGEKAEIINSIKKGLAEKAEDPINNVKSGLRDFYNGYQDNSKNSFTKGDIFNQVMGKNDETGETAEDGVLTGAASNIKKGLMARLGEAAGTGQRVMANPWTQAGIAALITRATGGDWDDVANNAYQYGINKATSNYYNSKLNPGSAPNALQNFTKDDYSAERLAEYRDILGDNARVKAEAYLDKNNPTYETYYNSLLANGDITVDEYNAFVTAPGYDPRRRISLDAIKNQNTKNYQQGQLGLGKEKNQIGWMNAGTNAQNAGTNAGRLQENIRHNNVTEGQNQQKIDNKTQSDLLKQEEKEEGVIWVKGLAPSNTVVKVPIEEMEEFVKNGGELL